MQEVINIILEYHVLFSTFAAIIVVSIWEIIKEKRGKDN